MAGVESVAGVSRYAFAYAIGKDQKRVYRVRGWDVGVKQQGDDFFHVITPPR